jgi:hypothetical protein
MVYERYGLRGLRLYVQFIFLELAVYCTRSLCANNFTISLKVELAFTSPEVNEKISIY